MKKLFLYMFVGYFIGPYSPYFYNLFDESMKYRHRCTGYFSFDSGKYKQKYFWNNYAKYVEKEVRLQEFFDKSWAIETPKELKDEGIADKKQWDKFNAELEEVRKR